MLKKLSLVVMLLCLMGGSITAQKIPGPHAIVYKTKGNYRCLVPVTLSDDGTKIISYPDPKDLQMHGKYALPAKLHKGYLLDNRGIGKNVAFLDYTYKQYGKLKAAPSVAVLYKHIKVKDPLVFYCDCGRRSAYKQPVKELNKLIDKHELEQKCNTK